MTNDETTLIVNGYQQFVVEGMTCAACVRRVEKAAQSVNGVNSASVNLVTEKINLSTTALNREELFNAVRKIGYKIIDDSGYDKVSKKNNKIHLQKKLLYKSIFALIIACISILLTLFRETLTTSAYISDQLFMLFILSISVPVQFWAGLDFHKKTFIATKTLTTNMNTLITLGTFSAFLYSLLVMFTDFGSININTTVRPLFFDTSNTIIAFVLLGHFLQERTKDATFKEVQLLSELKVDKVRIIEGEKEYEIPVMAVDISDEVIVKPFERISVDGVVINGNSSVEESFLTGESLPMTKTIGETVYAGSLNLEGLLRIRVVKKPEEFVIEKIIQLVEKAISSKVPIQSLVDKISSYFVPFVLLISIITFCFWTIFYSGNSFELALLNSLTVLVIACPCALGLATPIAIVASIGRSASIGLLIKDAAALQKANEVTTFIFDKTGTLTTGNPSITNIKKNHLFLNSKIDENSMIQLIASCERGSNHPFAKAILALAEKNDIELLWPEEFKTIEGLGIEAKVKSHHIIIGNKNLMDKNKITVTQKYLDDIRVKDIHKNSLIFISIDYDFFGTLHLEDPLKDTSISAVTQLLEQGRKVTLLTGDDENIAKKIATKIGGINWISGASPSEKMNYIKKQQANGEIVAMIGDGANDAPSLALADLSIFIPNNIESISKIAHVTIINNNLNIINELIAISHKTVKIIKQNLIWAFLYNIMLIPIATGIGYFLFSDSTSMQVPQYLLPIINEDGFLNPMIAAFAMAMSSVSVIINSMRLRNS
ncbi:MAG: cation-translocating P-type ATPase [Dehalococcoidia bacterium]|jgi:Cu+-exporting ATPase|nr:MAG: Cu+-exporting ATPase [Chloroflexota bacterium]|tara:strand:- start:846 stop:3167 length:2322 start_codon:yes stop_codon:yes gene_type:complete